MYISNKELIPITITYNAAIIHGMYMIMNWVYEPEPISSGGNTPFNPQVSVLIPLFHNDIKKYLEAVSLSVLYIYTKANGLK